MGSSLHEAIGDISDGEESGGGIISFSSSNPDAILVPDAIFHASQGYASLRAASASWVTGWQARKETIVWRGSTTGVGTISNAEMNPADASLLPRTRMCLMLRGSPGVDARIVGIAQSDDLEGDRSRLDHAGVLGNHIDPMTWLARKFAIDIDGNTNAWSNLFTRLLAGCCVIKIASPHGYRQWYYNALEPWRHFVPVNADFSDLHEKIDWCRAHDSRCEEIAEAGRAFALQREFASEMKGAVRTLERHSAGKGVGA
ncbi:glycosyl transferase family 90 [Oricola sp.]|uniref:glycosyl transferase family 90 n=1 Tax=Oricola sp. TaxID=1979950 RepID=UPI0025DDCFD7|nr:glycosyl transferase family 90 [Oricola sp.]MCI5073607.1 hypothetical protein [Oricola sp.]